MEIRWLAQLDRSGVLGLWRSWTGDQIYEVAVTAGAQGHGVLDGLKVEQHPDRYQGKLGDEPDRFERILVSVVNILRRFRAGYTPYCSAPDTGPEPPSWP